MEDAMLTLERRGISLRAHAERMDPETLRMPVFHLLYENDDLWFVTRDKLDEYMAANNIVAPTAEATKASQNGTGSREDADKIKAAPHVVELYEVRTINAGLKDLAAMDSPSKI